MSASQTPPPIQLALLDCTLLLVATPDSQTALAAGLMRNGFHQLLFACDANTALRVAAAEKPDLVLLDLSGNAFDGALLCEALRRTPDQNELPILVLAETHTPDEQLRILAAGATDVLVAPLHELKVVSRILFQLERRLLVRDLQDFRQRTATELATAREMQQALLPDRATICEIKERYDIGIAATFKPSTELGGDLWGAWPIDATRMGMFVCDVSGHGTIAAINTFRLHTIMARNDFDRSDPGRFLSSLNDRLTGLLGSGQYVTMFYAVIDTRQDRVTYAAAGSPDPLLILPGCPPEALDGSGLPLGIVAGVPYATQQAAFGPGARLMLQSDAMVEARLPDGTMLGDQAARAMIMAALAQDTPEAIVAALTQQITERAGDQLDDDLTLVCIERPGQARDDGIASTSTLAPAVTGRLLSVGRTMQYRLLVQQGAAASALAVDAAPDLTAASRFLAGYRYDVVVVDVTPGPEEWLELFHTIATANRNTRMLLIGVHVDLGRLLATSLGLTLAATLKVPTDADAVHMALVATLASDNVTLGKSA
jgi:sigma-B regulation protein RsbU (phosphoserine phosphatase)